MVRASLIALALALSGCGNAEAGPFRWHLPSRDGMGASVPSSLLTGLLGYWKLDGNSTASVGNSGTDTNVTYTTGKLGSAAVFGGIGSNSKIDVGSIALTSNSFSMSAWLMQTNSNNAQRAFSYHGNGPTWYVGGGNFSVVHSGTIDWSPAGGVSALVLNTWGFFVLTRSGNSWVLYKDGASIATTTLAVSFTANSTVQIGNSTAFNEPFAGRVDEPALWDHALSAAEVTALYNAGAGIQYPF